MLGDDGSINRTASAFSSEVCTRRILRMVDVGVEAGTFKRRQASSGGGCD